MREGEVSKRWIVSFGRGGAEQNVRFFKNSLKIEPLVHIVWYRRPDTGMAWKDCCYAVVEPGHRAWDITEPHFASVYQCGKRLFDCITEMAGAEFEAAVAARPARWFLEPKEEPLGKLVYEPYDDELCGIKRTHRYYSGINHEVKK